jgi:hypothetical protein
MKYANFTASALILFGECRGTSLYTSIDTPSSAEGKIYRTKKDEQFRMLTQ